MSEEAAAEEEGKHKRSFVIPLIIVVLLFAGVGYYVSSKFLFDQQLVEAHIKAWEEYIESSLSDEDRKLDLAYDSVEITGAGLDRYAVLSNARIAFLYVEEGAQPLEEVVYKTDEVELHPTSASLNEVKLRFVEPIYVRAKGELSGKIETEEPFEITFKQYDVNKKPFLQTSFPVPDTLMLESFVKEKTYTVTLDKGATFNMLTAADTRELHEVDTQIRNVLIKDSDDIESFKAKLIRLDADSKKVALGEYHIRIDGAVEELISDLDDMPYGAVSGKVNAEYAGPMPESGDEAVDWAAKPGYMKVHELEVEMDKAKLMAKADFKTEPEDLLPVGKAEIKVINFAFIREELKKHGVLDDESEMLLDLLLKQATGVDAKELTNVELVLEREPQKSLRIGKMTFEEGLAIVLTGGKLLPKEQAKDEVKPKTEVQ